MEIIHNPLHPMDSHGRGVHQNRANCFTKLPTMLRHTLFDGVLSWVESRRHSAPDMASIFAAAQTTAFAAKWPICVAQRHELVKFGAFIGNLHRTHQSKLIRRAVAMLDKKPGTINQYCIGEREWTERLEHAAGP